MDSNPPLPPAPHPSADPESANQLKLQKSLETDDTEDDIFQMTALSALKMLCNGMDTLVRLTGDVPPTPPLSQPNTPKMKKNSVDRRDSSDYEEREYQDRRQLRSPAMCYGQDQLDSIPFKKTPIGSPVSFAEASYRTIGADAEPVNVQHDAITRKFYSKQPPPITLEEYLLRIHRYCPLSTAVYLAASFYIHKLAVVERIISVTRLNVHRLMLAALRVASKALEDMSYPHKRFSKVGGVSELELGRLEISFCFLTNFELKVDGERLQRQVSTLREVANLHIVPGFQPKLPPLQENRPMDSTNYQASPRAVAIDI